MDLGAETRKVPRRTFIGAAAGLSVGLAVVGGGWAASSQTESALKRRLETTESQLTASLGDQSALEGRQAETESDLTASLDAQSSLQSRVQDVESRLAQSLQNEESLKTSLGEAEAKLAEFSTRYVAYGGGSNIKFMPDPVTGEPTVPMEEVWAFTKDFAFCRVDNNPQAFAMDTFGLGRVTVDANSFSMVMLTKAMEVAGFDATPQGAKIKLTGEIDCATAAAVAGTRVGSREGWESAPFEIVAAHDETEGDSFAFTVFFQPEQAPLNHAIFGPEATFTGTMKTGGITIKPVRNLPWISDKVPSF